MSFRTYGVARMTETVELKACPFCGAKPQKGPTKKEYDQLHGDEFQRYRIWCPHGHASVLEAAAIIAANTWNTRSDPAVRDRVKPLEWNATLAAHPFGTVTVSEGLDDRWRYTFHEYPYGTESDEAFDCIEAAKAAAQADYEQRILSALEPRTSPPEPASGSPTHRHKKRGTEYVLIGIGKMQAKDWWEVEFDQYGQHPVKRVNMVEVAIYRDVENWSLWARPLEEFEDGRFEPITAPPAKEPQ